MIKKLFTAFSDKPVSRETSESLDLNTIIADKDRRIVILEEQVKLLTREVRKPVKVISAREGDPDPSDNAGREAYVSRVAEFFQSFGIKKLEYLIAVVREELDWSGQEDHRHPTALPRGMTREQYDWFLRGTSNAFKILLDWGEQMIGEDVDYKNKNLNT